MANLVFTIPPPETGIAASDASMAWDSAYITGIEGIPWHSRYRTDGSQFSIGREIDESGKVHLMWPTSNFGNVCLSTTSLRLADRPYGLCVELARGTVNRLRTQISEWQRIGLRLPEDFFPLAEQSLNLFLRSLTMSSNQTEQAKLAQQAIEKSLEAAVRLCETYATQALDARRQTEGRLATLLGAEVGNQPANSKYAAIDKSFNLVSLPIDMAAVETSSGKPAFEQFDTHFNWAAQKDKKVCVGPLVNFRQGRLPRWMVLLGEGFENILKASCDHARSCVERYQGKAHIWNCAAGLNTPGEMRWSDEETLRIAVALIETVRKADQRSPVLLTIDQPWSEYLRKDDNGISPLHFADALIRADLGLSGLALDLRFGYSDDYSYPRDPIEISRLLDRWAMLGLPLLVQLSCPTLDSKRSTASKTSKQVLSPTAITELLLSKPCVHAVIWSDLVDLPQLATANGLWNVAGNPKPIISELAATRKKYLH